jgi:UDP-glucuronate 4-epimerase
VHWRDGSGARAAARSRLNWASVPPIVREHVLVTGAAGFIGSHLARRLRVEGHRVVGVDAYRGATTQTIAARRLGELCNDPGFDLVELDLVGGDLDRVVAGARAVFHFAARPGARDGDEPAFLRDNVKATAAVVAATTAADVPDLVFASSSSVYGDAGARAPCREGGPVRPLSPYAKTKRAAELLCLGSSLRSTIVRLFTVYGPHQRSDMAFQRFITASLTGAAAPIYQPLGVARDFTYVTDAVEGTILAWKHGTAPIYNVSGGKVVDLASACRLIEELTGANIETHPADAPPQPSATRADLSLARSQLGYRPRVGLRAGLKEQIATARADAPMARAG